jgi:hypothetical protein
MLFCMGATEDTAWRRSAAAGSDGFIAGRGTTSASQAAHVLGGAHPLATLGLDFQELQAAG